VTVIGADNKPVPRPVKIASQQDESWVVTGGLKEGEKVMVDGFQKLQMLPPGTPVKPVQWTPAGAQQAPAQAGAAAAQPNAAGAKAAATTGAGDASTPDAGSPAAGATTPANSSR
jgi:membrane fusion protein (multidrug efflux system)